MTQPPVCSPEPCPRCGVVPHIERDGYGYTVACDGCYDGAPDSPRRDECVAALSRDVAVDQWNDLVEEMKP